MVVPVDKIPKVFSVNKWYGVLQTTHRSCSSAKISYEIRTEENDNSFELCVRASLLYGTHKRWEIDFRTPTQAISSPFTFIERLRELAELPYNRLQNVEVAMQILCGRSPDPEDARY